MSVDPAYPFLATFACSPSSNAACGFPALRFPVAFTSEAIAGESSLRVAPSPVADHPTQLLLFTRTHFGTGYPVEKPLGTPVSVWLVPEAVAAKVPACSGLTERDDPGPLPVDLPAYPVFHRRFRISQVPDQSVAARHPLSPRQVAPVLSLIASRCVLASASLAAWPPAFCVSRPFSVQPVTAYGSPLRCLRLPTLPQPDQASPGAPESTENGKRSILCALCGSISARSNESPSGLFHS